MTNNNIYLGSVCKLYVQCSSPITPHRLISAVLTAAKEIGLETRILKGEDKHRIIIEEQKKPLVYTDIAMGEDRAFELCCKTYGAHPRFIRKRYLFNFLNYFSAHAGVRTHIARHNTLPLRIFKSASTIPTTL